MGRVLKGKDEEMELEAKGSGVATIIPVTQSGAPSVLLLPIFLPILSVSTLLSQLRYSSLSMFDRACVCSGRTSFSNRGGLLE